MPFQDVNLNDGNKIPSIAYGTGTTRKDQDATKYVTQALEVGFTHIDTAQIYHNEDSVGVAIQESGLPRSALYITTKYSTDPIRQSIKASLRRLGLDYVDLYLIHHPMFVEPDFEGAWKELEKIKEEGLAKSIGVSSFNLEQLQTIVRFSKIPPAVNQIELHPYNYHKNKPLLEYSAKHGIVIEAFSSLASITKYPGGPVDAPVNAAAKRRGVAPNQIIMAWVRAKGAVIVTTSSSENRLHEYLSAADIDPLTVGEIKAIDEAGARGLPPHRGRF
ncbi:Aldo/keto reductase [Collybia nuda]|uniref:Aldo/keto reductase n=1 Tax=Collybia nuda TaxID=64659 RepID=A0A9P6CFL5_9AGAR|nr:Aldo/keto reductase [Collybia nuda]